MGGAMEPDAALQDYCLAWSTADDDARAALLARVWADAGVYSDPSAQVRGRAALHAHIGGMHAKMPGTRIVLSTQVSQHHGYLYFGWQMITADGDVRIDGVDFAQVDENGRIAQIVGFFGPPGA